MMTPFSPPKEPQKFSATEQAAIVQFVRGGGRALVIAEEERRMDLETYGINAIIKAFGMEFGPDTPVRHNVGAIALQGEISTSRKELPYSRGRVLTGGSAEGVRLSGRGGAQGDTVVEAGASAGGGLGAEAPPTTPPAATPAAPVPGGGNGAGGRGFALATRFWGKDSVPFMQEVVAWLLQ